MHTVDFGYLLSSSINPGISRQDFPDSTDTTSVERRVAKPDRLDDPSPRIVPPSSEVSRLPASLRPVHGFPVLRLLWRLRPCPHSSPVSAASPFPWRASGTGSHVPISNPRIRRRHALPLAILDGGIEGVTHHLARIPCQPVWNIKPNRIGSQDLGSIKHSRVAR